MNTALTFWHLLHSSLNWDWFSWWDQQKVVHICEVEDMKNILFQMYKAVKDMLQLLAPNEVRESFTTYQVKGVSA